MSIFSIAHFFLSVFFFQKKTSPNFPQNQGSRNFPYHSLPVASSRLWSSFLTQDLCIPSAPLFVPCFPGNTHHVLPHHPWPMWTLQEKTPETRIRSKCLQHFFKQKWPANPWSSVEISMMIKKYKEVISNKTHIDDIHTTLVCLTLDIYWVKSWCFNMAICAELFQRFRWYSCKQKNGNIPEEKVLMKFHLRNYLWEGFEETKDISDWCTKFQKPKEKSIFCQITSP